jgi:hypothetical protein
VKSDTLKKRLLDFPDQFLLVQGDHLYCGTYYTNVGSYKSDVRQHCNTIQYTTMVQHKIAGSQRRVQTRTVVVECLDRGGRGRLGEGVGRLVLA